jgi:hypothetical protein
MVVGYEEKMSLTTSGLALQNGNRINEFSIDGTLSGNSNLAVPTEKAVKTYVDNNNSSNYWKKGNLNSAGSITATNTYQPIGPTLVINKEFADSRVEATVNSQMYGGNFSSAFAVIFQIRINGSNTTFENTAVIDRTNTLDFLSIHAVFMGLPAGFHTIQIYARSAGSGTSTSVQIDPTGYGGAMIVKETF